MSKRDDAMARRAAAEAERLRQVEEALHGRGGEAVGDFAGKFDAKLHPHDRSGKWARTFTEHPKLAHDLPLAGSPGRGPGEEASPGVPFRASRGSGPAAAAETMRLQAEAERRAAAGSEAPRAARTAAGAAGHAAFLARGGPQPAMARRRVSRGGGDHRGGEASPGVPGSGEASPGRPRRVPRNAASRGFRGTGQVEPTEDDLNGWTYNATRGNGGPDLQSLSDDGLRRYWSALGEEDVDEGPEQDAQHAEQQRVRAEHRRRRDLVQPIATSAPAPASRGFGEPPAPSTPAVAAPAAASPHRGKDYEDLQRRAGLQALSHEDLASKVNMNRLNLKLAGEMARTEQRRRQPLRSEAVLATVRERQARERERVRGLETEREQLKAEVKRRHDEAGLRVTQGQQGAHGLSSNISVGGIQAGSVRPYQQRYSMQRVTVKGFYAHDANGQKIGQLHDTKAEAVHAVFAHHAANGPHELTDKQRELDRQARNNARGPAAREVGAATASDAGRAAGGAGEAPGGSSERIPGATAVVGGKAGRWVKLNGKQTHIPHHAEFSRDVGGDTFTSPAGSTHVFKNGEAFNSPRGVPAPDRTTVGRQAGAARAAASEREVRTDPNAGMRAAEAAPDMAAHIASLSPAQRAALRERATGFASGSDIVRALDAHDAMRREGAAARRGEREPLGVAERRALARGDAPNASPRTGRARTAEDVRAMTDAQIQSEVDRFARPSTGAGNTPEFNRALRDEATRRGIRTTDPAERRAARAGAEPPAGPAPGGTQVSRTIAADRARHEADAARMGRMPTTGPATPPPNLLRMSDAELRTYHDGLPAGAEKERAATALNRRAGRATSPVERVSTAAPVADHTLYNQAAAAHESGTLDAHVSGLSTADRARLRNVIHDSMGGTVSGGMTKAAITSALDRAGSAPSAPQVERVGDVPPGGTPEAIKDRLRRAPGRTVAATALEYDTGGHAGGAGARSVWASHMRDLIASGAVVKEGDSYRLAPESNLGARVTPQVPGPGARDPGALTRALQGELAAQGGTGTGAPATATPRSEGLRPDLVGAPTRSSAGRLRNFTSMSDTKLLQTYGDHQAYSAAHANGDREGEVALHAELDRRGLQGRHVVADTQRRTGPESPPARRARADAAELRPDLYSPGRSSAGRLRNYRSMSDDKLATTARQLAAHGGDEEAMTAVRDELRRRESGAGTPPARASRPLSRADRIRAMVDGLGMTREEAIAELTDMGEASPGLPFGGARRAAREQTAVMSGLSTEQLRDRIRRLVASPVNQSTTGISYYNAVPRLRQEYIDELHRRGLQEVSFSAEERRKLAKKGQAQPDGSFPIRNARDLGRAIQAVGRGGDPEADRAWIIKRARALKLTAKLPDEWNVQENRDRARERRIEERIIAEAVDSLAKAHTPEPFSTSKTSNWVARNGGLPPYIQHVAHGLVESGKTTSEAIQMAVGIVKRWAAGGGKVDAGTRAAAALAVRQWEQLKAENAAKGAAGKAAHA